MKRTKQNVQSAARWGFILLLIFTLTGQAEAQTCVQPPTGLVSWWPGDGNANDILDGNNGTLIGGATFAAGKVGLAFSFDGIDDAVDIPRNPTIFALTEGTVDMWVRILDLSSFTTRLFSIADAGPAPFSSDQWSLDYRNEGPGFGNIQVTLVSGGSLVSAGLTPSDTIHDTDFHHLAVVADGVGTIEVYVDGVSQLVLFALGSSSDDFFFGDATNADNMKIGAIERDSISAEGAKVIDEVEIFDRPLSSLEIQAIFNAGSAGKCKKVDHFKCYTAEGDSVNQIVDLQDQFDIEPDVLVAKPKLFCNPVDKNSEGILNPAAHLTCYKINDDGVKRNVFVENQFGVQTLKVGKPELLCVPSQKIAVEPIHSTDEDEEDEEEK